MEGVPLQEVRKSATGLRAFDRRRCFRSDQPPEHSANGGPTDKYIDLFGHNQRGGALSPDLQTSRGVVAGADDGVCPYPWASDHVPRPAWDEAVAVRLGSA